MITLVQLFIITSIIKLYFVALLVGLEAAMRTASWRHWRQLLTAGAAGTAPPPLPTTPAPAAAHSARAGQNAAAARLANWRHWRQLLTIAAPGSAPPLLPWTPK